MRVKRVAAAATGAALTYAIKKKKECKLADLLLIERIIDINAGDAAGEHGDVTVTARTHHHRG